MIRKSFFTLSTAVLAALPSGLLAGTTVYRVDDNGTGTTCGSAGSNWTTAFTELQAALDCVAQQAGNGPFEIWVAEGTYTPDFDVATGSHNNDPTMSFELASNLKIYGGFKVGDTSVAGRTGLRENTTLSGALSAGTSCHVVSAGGTDDSTALLDSFTITGGDATQTACGDQEGGGILIQFGSPTINNCYIVNNEAKSGGGLANNNGLPTLTDNLFSGNMADNGGGMWTFDGTLNADNPSTFTISDCDFSGNSADIDGGGLHIAGSSRPTVSNCDFTNTNSARHGGGVAMIGTDYTLFSTAQFVGCTFDGNVASLLGGGLYHQDAVPSLQSCTFEGNQAEDGAGMASWTILFSTTQHTPTLNLCDFELNIASNIGGGYYGRDITASILGCDFTDNRASDGGGIYLDKSLGQITGGTVYSNDALGGFNSKGGGIYLGSCEVAVSTVTILENTAPNGEGGGVYIQEEEDNLAPSITTCTIKTNSARSGGGVHIQNSAIIISDSTIEDNTASLQGGGIFADELRPVSVIDTSILLNTSSSQGGGVYTKEHKLSLTDCIFTKNDAASGGGIYADSGIQDYERVRFFGNKATTGNGGAAYINNLQQNHTASISECVFSGNEAPGSSGNGAALWLGNPGNQKGTPDHDIRNCTFSKNAAGANGGGLYLNNTQNNGLTMRGGIFWENTAPLAATEDIAQIFEAGTTAPTVQYTTIQDDVPDDGMIPYDDAFNTNKNKDVDPLFRDPNPIDPITQQSLLGTGAEDLRLLDDTSPAVDAGYGTSLPSDTDVLLQPRCVRILLDPEGDPCEPDTAPDMGAYELQVDEKSCTTRADCADINADGIRDDLCSWYDCVNNACTVVPRSYPSDMVGAFGACPIDGTCDGNDAFAALNCFANTDPSTGGPYSCEDAAPNALNVDAGSAFGSCALDGICDGNDRFHALNCFGNANTCGDSNSSPCIAPSPEFDGPSPAPSPEGPGQAGAMVNVTLRAASDVVSPGDSVLVDVFLDEGADVLPIGYQLQPVIVGGTTGSIGVVDFAVHDRGDFVFGEIDHDKAFNLNIGQMVVMLGNEGLGTPGDIATDTPSGDGLYLATIVLQVDDSAEGMFAVDLLHSEFDEDCRTYFFGAPIEAVEDGIGAIYPVGIANITPALITVDGGASPDFDGPPSRKTRSGGTKRRTR